jgi:hypothetical protein
VGSDQNQPLPQPCCFLSESKGQQGPRDLGIPLTRRMCLDCTFTCSGSKVHLLVCLGLPHGIGQPGEVIRLCTPGSESVWHTELDHW